MVQKDPTKVANAGSAIGEAIGDLLEFQVHKIFRDIERKTHSVFLSRYGKTKSGEESKKLLLQDRLGNDYNIDGLVIDESGHPLILVESKYIRYKKHNRDKASWICNAHTAIRKKYASIRASIAVLAGNWSKTSLQMLVTNNVNYFLIPFSQISKFMAEMKVDIEWDEKDKNKARKAWLDFSKLSETKKGKIGQSMIGVVKDKLGEFIVDVLDDKKIRKISKIVIELHTNKGETFIYEFPNVDKAKIFLENFDNDFNETQFISVYKV